MYELEREPILNRKQRRKGLKKKRYKKQHKYNTNGLPNRTMPIKWGNFIEVTPEILERWYCCLN